MQDIESLLKLYEDGPEQLAGLVRDLNASQLNAVPVPGKWSIRQVVCHIADFEIVAADRVRRVLAEDNPLLADGDPDQFASSLCYSERDVGEELQLIASVRGSTARILRGCELEDFQRTGVHSMEGPMTLETLVERAVNHIPHHVTFIQQKLDALFPAER